MARDRPGVAARANLATLSAQTVPCIPPHWEAALPTSSTRSIEVAPTVEGEVQLREWLSALLVEAGWGEAERFGILLAVGEVFLNAVRHGYAPSGITDLVPVEVALATAPRAIEVRLREPYAEWDGAAAVSHAASRRREGVGGYGLTLIDRYVDALVREARPPWTIVVLRKTID